MSVSYTHNVALEYGSGNWSALKLPRTVQREKLLDAVANPQVQFVFIYMYNTRIRRYSMLVLYLQENHTRTANWFTFQAESGVKMPDGETRDLAPYVLVQELNYGLLMRDTMGLLVNNQFISHYPLDADYQNLSVSDEYDSSDHMQQTRRYILASYEKKNEAIVVNYYNYIPTRWHPLLLYQALKRQCANARDVIFVQPAWAIENEEVMRVLKTNRFYITPNYYPGNESNAGFVPLIRTDRFTPLRVEFDSVKYVFLLYDDEHRLTFDGTHVVIRLHGMTQPWHSAFHVQKMVSQIAKNAHEWSQRARRTPNGASAYILQQFRTLDPRTDIVEQDVMESTRLVDCDEATLWAIRLSLSFPRDPPQLRDPASELLDTIQINLNTSMHANKEPGVSQAEFLKNRFREKLLERGGVI
jgi:hypothetical protein